MTLPVPRTFNGGPGDDLFVAGVDSGQPNDYHGDAGTGHHEVHVALRRPREAQLRRSRSTTWPTTARTTRATTSTRTSSTPSARTRPTSSRAPPTPTTWSATAAPTRSTATAATTGCSPTIRTTPAQKICDADVVNGGEGADEITLGGHTTANGGAGDDTLRTFPLTCTRRRRGQRWRGTGHGHRLRPAALVPDREGAEGQPRRRGQRRRRRPQQLRDRHRGPVRRTAAA